MKYTVAIFLLPLIGFCQIESRLLDYMDRQSAINGFSGSVLVMKKDNVLLEKAFGHANQEWNVANTPDTKFVLASITKYFTAIAIMKLVEQGKLSVEDKLERFFPGYPKSDKVNIHMMLTHTAGLPLDFDELYVNSGGVSGDSALSAMMRKPYLFEPGSSRAYSNIGYYLLGQIIEKASGTTYAAFLKRTVFDPAGMTDSGVCNNDSIVNRKAEIYYKENGIYLKNPFIDWNLNVGHDGAYATARDLYRLDRALYGEAVLTKSSKKLMETAYTKKLPDGGFFDTYGYGIFVDPYYNHGHSLRTHSGGFIGVMTTFDRYPDDDVFVAVLSNNGSESHIVGYALSAIVFGLPVDLPYVHLAASEQPTKLERFAGEYGSVKIVLENGKLYLGETKAELVAESPTLFFRKDNPDRTFEFVSDKRGKTVAVLVGKGGVKEKKTKNKRVKRP
ncbi:serine hydrolase domain-containing protein [Flavobacterium selenitireducens]|uniref:serine hydrolase domain-containing protein n=1 Tax=Flavobacterium selenitireducens TaxID=2722704 RepID=UPI00168B8668|nr:serine hydrolase domain-containing protein [Flavobacterium selenitireducens]MBD3582777.1 beta-lactamase family protein [Flavobacterium selenitireducens]